jgi:hypothetical protein
MTTSKSTNKHFYGVKNSMETISNTLCVFHARALAIAIACFSSASFATQGTDYITPAKYQTMDKYNVNVAGNQLAPTIETVAIGGELGLTHSITARGNYFDLARTNDGYHDKYAGGLKFTELGTRKSPGGYPDVPGENGQATVMRASFLGQQADFMVIKNDGTYLWGSYDGMDYYYKAVGDQRHTLERRTDGLVWTQPDGTEVFLSTANATNTASAHYDFAVQKIVYPNGFTIVVGSLVGVMTNTGFALRYDFDPTDPGLESSKQSRVFPNGSNVPPVSGSSFRDANPKYVTAINTAIDACDISISTSCTFTKNWPKATFTWPGGMPRAFFIDRSTFSVTNAAGVKTDLIYEAQDAGIPPNPAIPSNTPWKLVAPRLVEIKSAGATASTAVYTYTNENPTVQTVNNGNVIFVSTPIYDDRLLPGVLASATGILGSQFYNTSDLREYHGKSYRGADMAVSQYTSSPMGILEKVDDFKGDRAIAFELTYRNFVTTETFGWAPKKVYHYDARGNVDSVTQGSAVALAGYPTTCSNRKTCNKPDWVKDPNGNQTTYTYHPQSGQLQTVTSPPNKNGISAVVRYGYEQKFAKYKQTPGGSPVQASTGVWLKVSEKTCNNTNTVGDACAGNSAWALSPAQDEVVTTYKYDNNNLLMTEMTVTAADSTNVVRTKRTCFQYDIYGNRIGETQPNAQLASCTP